MAQHDRKNCRVVDLGLIPYRAALSLQKRDVERLQRGDGEEVLYLLEHPHVITLGRNASGDAIRADRRDIARRGVEVARTDRGGNATYHGPGQLVGYPLLRLEPGRRDIRRYVDDMEDMLIRTVADFGIAGKRHSSHRGVWVAERKIASVGIRISRWVTCHGFALNVSTDLSHFSLINPCGIEGCIMTSMERELSRAVDMASVRQAVARHFSEVYDRSVIWERAEALVEGRGSDG
jgi:lipoate-protein ligase B